MYIPDLAPHAWATKEEKDLNTLAIGWLDNKHEFNVGKVSDEFLYKLTDFCNHRLRLMRGFQECEFCPPMTALERFEKFATIGNGEIRVLGVGRIYAAPTMIHHYISVHHYLPPKEFIEAVLISPKPNTHEYQCMEETYWVEE